MKADIGTNSKGEPRVRLLPQTREERELLLRFNTLKAVVEGRENGLFSDMTYEPCDELEDPPPLFVPEDLE